MGVRVPLRLLELIELTRSLRSSRAARLACARLQRSIFNCEIVRFPRTPKSSLTRISFNIRLDPLQQFAKLHNQLTEERSQLQSRLSQINQVLGVGSTGQAPPSVAPAEIPARPANRRRRKPKGANELSLREAVLKALSQGPLARKELVKAVEDVGYVFNTKNPLNSIGSILYGKKTPIKNKGGKYYLPRSAAAVTTVTADDVQEPAPAKKKKRTMSAAAKAKISLAQKAAWAKRKRAK
jgi:hypothetical protein